MSARDEVTIGDQPFRWFAGAGKTTRRALATRDDVTSPRCFPGAFSAKECAAIRALAARFPEELNTLGNPTEGYRHARSRWILPVPDGEWLMQRLEELFVEANRHYKFDIRGFVDPFLVVSYPKGNGFGWHVDATKGLTATRKLSLSVQLSPREAYDGGALQFSQRGELPLSRGLGTAICFPAFASHSVTPIRRGSREVLVAWAHGPTFR